MAEVIAALIILVQTGDAIREIINKGYDVSGKLKQFHDQLDSLSKELERWTTAIIDFGLTNDEELLRKIRDAKSTLDKVKSSLFGKDDDCCGRYSSKVKLWLFPAKLESSIQEVTSFSADIKSSLTGKKEIDTLACERLLQGPSNFDFSSDARYIPLEQTEKNVITALKNSEERPVILLHGPSGTGKSTLARNLALRFQNETKERIDGHAPRSQQAYTSGPEFDKVVYMECGPEVKLPAKKKYLVEQLAPSAISALAPTDTDDVDNKITKVLHGLLKDKPLLIILDDVWECEGESSQKRSNFLQEMVRLGGELVKWLVTSQSQDLCRGLNIKRDFYRVRMEEVKPEDGKRILATLAGVEILALSAEIQDILGRIVAKTGANLLALTCVASTVREESNKQVEEWKGVEKDLLDVLESPPGIHMHDIRNDRSYWGAIRLGFQRLSLAQKNLLILIHMCEGPSVSSDVIEYLFKQTRSRELSEGFLNARNALQGRNLLTIKTTSHVALGKKERWSIHNLLREFINREVFGKDDRVSIVETLAKEKIMFEKGSRTELEHDVVISVASLYFGHDFAEKMGMSSWISTSAHLGRQVIDPIVHLLGLTEDEQWTSALHSSIFQVLVNYVRHRKFDEESTSGLLNSPISKVPILCSLGRSGWNFINNHLDLFVGQHIMHALFRLLEEITLVIKAPPNYLSPCDETVLHWTVWGFAVALNNGQDKNNISDLSHARLKTIIERLMLGLGAVADSLHSNRSVEISQKSENMSFNSDVRVVCACALAHLAYAGGGIQEKMIDFPELLESLVNAMRTKDSPILQEAAAHAIQSLALPTEIIGVKIVNYPGVLAIQSRASPTEIIGVKIVNYPGVLAIRSRASPTEIIGVKIVNYPGVLDALVDGLDSSSNQRFHTNSSCALANLALIPSDRIKWKIIMFEGAVRRLIFAILNVHDREVKEGSARALANLATGGGGIKEKMIDFPELLESLVKAMRRKDVPGLQEDVASVIINLASCGATEIIGLKIVNYPGVLDALVDGLDSSKNQGFQRNSALALANLANKDDDQIKWKIIMFEGAVRRLIFAILNVHDHEVKEASARALANLAMGGGGIIEKMIDFPELLESLVKAMRTKDSPILQREGAHAIANLASPSFGAAEIIGLKIINYPRVLDALVDGLDSSKNQGVQWNSAWALANLAGIPGDQIKWKIFIFEGAVRRLIFAILNVHDHEVKEQSARALANLAMGGGGIKEKMIDFPELLESLVKAMRTKDSPILQEEGARVIDNLAAPSSGATEIIGLKIVNYPEVLDALVDGLDSSKNQGFQRNSAWALANLAAIPGEQIKWKIIMFEGAVRRLIFAILHVHDHEVKEKSTIALANLAMGGGGIKEKMIDFPELLESLVKAMRTKDSPGLQEEAARAIINLASPASGATEIMGLKIVNYLGVLDALVDGLDSSKNGEFQCNSAWALANLAYIPGDQIKWKIIMFERAVRRLIFAMVNVDDNDVRKRCALAIRNVARGGNDIRMKIKVDFPEILDVLENAVGRGEKSGDDIEDGMVGLTLLDPLKAKGIQVSAPEVYLWRGCGELFLGLYKDALEDFDRYDAICTLKIRNAENVFSLRCCAKAKLGDLQGALADADRHVGLHCTRFSLQERGVVKCMSGDFRGAVEDLNASLRLSGEDHYEVLKHRGFVHFMMDDEKSARADAERAIRCKPSRINDAEYGHRSLGTSSVHYLDFELK